MATERILSPDVAQRLLTAHGQSHVLAFWDRLDEAGHTALLRQLSAIDFAEVERLRGVLAGKSGAEDAPSADMEPAPVTVLAGVEREAAIARGEAELRAGRVGALLVAGGQGSRLGFNGPKGCCPVGPVTNAPLFFFHARKLLALRRAYGRPVPLYIMTSDTNDAQIRSVFRENAFFGLPEEDVFLFQQGMLPALTPEGRMLLERPNHVFTAPDGHGGVLAALSRSGALDDMEARGLTTIYHFQVDNPMTDVAAPEAVGFHVAEGADATLLACLRSGPDDKMGMPVLRGGRTAIVEYTEFSPERMHEREPDGALRFRWASPSPYLFAVSFLRRMAAAGLPTHLAHKKVPFVGPDGEVVRPEKPNAWKFEKFVFDALAGSRKTVCLAFDREEGYAPVKNAEGEKSPAAARADLSRKWARWLAACGVAVPLDANGRPRQRIEIDPAFAHSAEALRARLSAPDAPTIPSDGDILLRNPE